MMRSAILPGSSGQDEKDRKALLEACISRYSSPGTVTLFLEDLPIVAARKNYSHMVNGELVPLPTKISREKHIFYVRFSPLLSQHVHNINTVFLEEAWHKDASLPIVVGIAPSSRVLLRGRPSNIQNGLPL